MRGDPGASLAGGGGTVPPAGGNAAGVRSRFAGPALALIAVAACAVVLAPSQASYAYGIGEDAIKASIPFPFEAGGKSLPPGTYRFGHRVGPFASVQFSSMDDKVRLSLLAVERPTRRRTPDVPAAGLVFDKIGDRHVLSEVWLPEKSGFRLRSTETPHDRVIVNANE